MVLASSFAQERGEEERIKVALSAAPSSLSEHATVMDWDTRDILRPGSNGYFCFPTSPSGAPNPMCIDETFIGWLEALFNREPPPRPPTVTIGYWLQGANSGGSNEAPGTTKEERASHVKVPGDPHLVIIVPDLKMLDGITTDPKQGGPWVMYKDTPYAHLMVPAPRPGRD